ncbi:hypothetical protein DL768_003846 [Monosporascus sp. mg162]|nr:hypothetical protein DL768_003846 [Monosporascus sp. mg162]
MALELHHRSGENIKYTYIPDLSPAASPSLPLFSYKTLNSLSLDDLQDKLNSAAAPEPLSPSRKRVSAAPATSESKRLKGENTGVGRTDAEVFRAPLSEISSNPRQVSLLEPTSHKTTSATRTKRTKRTKPQFAGAASDPTQRQITSFFSSATGSSTSASLSLNTSPSVTAQALQSAGTPPLPASVQKHRQENLSTKGDKIEKMGAGQDASTRTSPC